MKYELLTFLTVLHDEAESRAIMDEGVHILADVLMTNLAHQLFLLKCVFQFSLVLEGYFLEGVDVVVS